jgi:hypothetical protein
MEILMDYCRIYKEMERILETPFNNQKRNVDHPAMR